MFKLHREALKAAKEEVANEPGGAAELLAEAGRGKKHRKIECRARGCVRSFPIPHSKQVEHVAQNTARQIRQWIRGLPQ